jgi:DNA-binding GntR family transcriptional regulator
MTFQQILELYVVREALDGAAARLAARSASELEVNELESLNESMRQLANLGDAAGIARLNVDFHQSVARASHNSMLAKFIDDTYTWVRRFQTTRFSLRPLADQALAEHDEIITAIQARDGDAAHEAASRHMRNALLVRLRLERAGRPGAG